MYLSHQVMLGYFSRVLLQARQDDVGAQGHKSLIARAVADAGQPSWKGPRDQSYNQIRTPSPTPQEFTHRFHVYCPKKEWIY